MKEAVRVVEIPESARKRQTVIAVIVVAVVAVFGTLAVLSLTSYESYQTVEFTSNEAGLTFVVHLRTEGPFSTHKPVTVGNVQVLAYPPQEIHRVILKLSGVGARWDITMAKDVNYPAFESNGLEFWTEEDAKGSIEFQEDGEQTVLANLWTDVWEYEWMTPSGSTGANVTVVPKETDLLWSGARYSAIGIILGVALAAGPEAVKDIRDLRYGLH